MNRSEFRQRLEEGVLLTDGAMGTMLHLRGASLEQSFDVLNRQQPALVARIHQEYIDAGADVIETNTFGANRFKLAEFGLQSEVSALNQAAVTIARRVIDSSFKPVLLAGAVGPLGVRLAPLGRVSLTEAHAAFVEQIEALISSEPSGVDLLIIETLSDIVEMEVAVSAARSVSIQIPIVANMAFSRDDRTLLGQTPNAVAERLAKLDVDVFGVNCSVGPAQVLRLVSLMRRIAPQAMLAALPNAGWPEQSEGGRVIYPAVPDYFGQYARAFVEVGVRVIGGCCGTSHEHIAAMRRALDTPGKNRIPLPLIEVETQEEAPSVVIDQPTQLETYLSKGKFVATVEMSPPKGIATQRLLAGARMLKEAGANFLNIADSPLARMRMSAWAAAYLVQQEIGLEAILHFPTRGRNLLRIQGDLLAAYAMGIRNLFVTMGDPTRIGDFPEAMDSYDIVPTGLIQLISEQFNKGRDKAGHTIDQATNFVVGCALDMTSRDLNREIELFRKKGHHGATFALTQPIFDPQEVASFLDKYWELYGEQPIPILAGIKPLYSSRNAEFLHNEVPGIQVPDELRRRMALASNPQQEGVRIAQEILESLRPMVQGVYLMPAFGRYDLVAEVLDTLS